jgi:hypothetical protein
MTDGAAKTFNPRAWAFNLEYYADYDPVLPYLRLDRLARWQFKGARENNDPNPIEKDGGTTSCVFAWGDAAFGQYLGKTFVLRHTLPSGYKVSFRGAVETTGKDGSDVLFSIKELGNWEVVIKGPKGRLPDGFELQIFRQDWQHLVDDTSRKDTDAEKVFNPDYLRLMKEDRPYLLRMMKPQGTEDRDFREVADMPTLAERTYIRGMPLEAMVALCNYVKTGLYFCQWHRSEDDLIRHCAEYIRDNLSPELPVVIEHYNEIWNSLYKHKDYFGALGVRRIGERGPGSLSGEQGERTFRATGNDRSLRRIFRKHDTLSVGDHYYYMGKLSENQASRNSVKTHNKWNLIEATVEDAPWYYVQGFQKALQVGWITTATNTAVIWSDVFASKNQRDRLTCALGTQGGGHFLTNALMESKWWRGQSDYRDPHDTFDAVVVNPYIGSTFLAPNALTRQTLETAMGQSQQEFNRVLAQICLGTHPDRAVNDDAYRRLNIPRLADDLKGQREVIGDLKLQSYEGGVHITHRGISKVKTFSRAFEAFLQSPEAEQVFAAWAKLHEDHMDGPIMQFHWMGGWGQGQHYAMRTGYDFPDDSRIRALRSAAERPIWW